MQAPAYLNSVATHHESPSNVGNRNSENVQNVDYNSNTNSYTAFDEQTAMSEPPAKRRRLNSAAKNSGENKNNVNNAESKKNKCNEMVLKLLNEQNKSGMGYGDVLIMNVCAKLKENGLAPVPLTINYDVCETFLSFVYFFLFL